MREIKFRGFNPNKKVWYYGSYVKTLDAPQHRIFYDIDGEVDWNSGVLPKTVGQFTGLKDKNGVDIYEGDICMSWFEDGYIPCVVSWSEYFPRLELNAINADEYGTQDFFTRGQHLLEVIGNIHEKPELLK